MNKILTISIAAYNVGKYIDNALSSIVIDDYMEKIEVFIVDDGSNDNTEELAQSYVEKWPDTFKYIKKENGGYGSTVNYSVKNANGKYIKLLDGDDSFISSGLKSLIDILENNQYEVVVSQAIRHYTDGKEDLIFSFLNDENDGHLIDIDEHPEYCDVAVWGYTFRTDIVRKCWNDLPLHSFYTDRIFVLQSLINTTSIYYMNVPVYKYRVGIDEQSTSVKSVRKHYKEMINVDKICCELCANYPDAVSHEYIVRRLGLYFGYTVCMLMYLDKTHDNLRTVKEYENTIRKSCTEIYNLMPKLMKRVKLLRKTNYLIYYMWPIIELFRK